MTMIPFSAEMLQLEEFYLHNHCCENLNPSSLTTRAEAAPS
jgi:hypothetical protein